VQDFNLHGNYSKNIIDSVNIKVTSYADLEGIQVTAKETEPDSKKFVGLFSFSADQPDQNKLLVDSTDLIVAEYISDFKNDTLRDKTYFEIKPLEVHLDIIGDTTFCANEQLDITLDAGSGYASYLWSDGITKTQSLDVTEPGYYSVSVSNEYGCIITSDTVKVIPLPTPEVELSVSDTITLCEGFELDAGECEDSCIYLWNTGDTTQFLPVYNTGHYDVTVTNKYNCTGTDQVFVSEVNKMPVADFDYSFINPFTISFESTSSYGLVYSWNFGDGYSATSENPSHMFDETGNYEVMLIVINNCGKDTITKIIEVTDVPENILNNSVTIYPNPTKNLINIKFRGLKSDMQIELLVTDLVGNLQKFKTIVNPTGNTETTLNLSDLQKGMYYLTIRSKNHSITRKIIKL